MKYRQWKKNYKKRYGVNPPIELDKRKQRRAARRALKKMTAAGSFCSLADVAERVADTFTNLTATLLRNIGGAFDTAGTVCRNAADGIQPLEVKGRVFSWEVRTYDRITAPAWVLPYKAWRSWQQAGQISHLEEPQKIPHCENPDCESCPFPPCEKRGGGK